MSGTAPLPAERIAQRRVELLFENVLVSQGFSVVNASLLTWLRFDEQPLAMTVWWLLAMLAVALRLGLTWFFHHRRARFADRLWLRLKGAAALLSGVIWGGGAVIMLSQGGEWDVMLTAFTVAGMTAAAVPLLSAQMEIYSLYSASMLAPSIATLLWLPPTRWTLTMALMTILFWIALLSSSRRFAAALLNEIEREAELAVAKEKAEAASRAKTAFLANIGHEIRTPMNGLVGMAEVLRLSELDEQQIELADVLVQSGRSLMDILNQILDFTDLEAGRHVVDSVPCSPAELVTTVARMFEASARIKGLAIEIDLAPDLPGEIVAARQDIARILTALIGNAVKFTSEGLVRVSARCERNTLRCSVSDTGPGIPAAEQERIFAAFTQVDESYSRDHAGLGLGLAMARRNARLLGGDIVVEGAPGEGSRFTLHLPVERRADRPDRPFEPGRDRPPSLDNEK